MKLLFIACSQIGDAVLSTGVLNHMIQTHPDIEVTVAASPLALPLFEAVPRLNRLIPIKKRSLCRHWLNLWKSCRQERWDVIMDIRGSFVSYFLKTSKRCVWRASAKGHRVEQLGRLIDMTPPPPPYLWLGPAHLQKAQTLISDATPVLVLAPGASWIGKQWPPASFAALADQFLKRHDDAKVAVVGASCERAIIQPILEAIPQHKAIDLAGGLSLLDIGACLKRCRLFVGNDSGLMHMAAAVGTPVIGLFGPSDERLYAPYCSLQNARHRVIRTPESLNDLKKTPNFSFQAPRSFMGTLKLETALQELEEMWQKQESAAVFP